MKIPLEPGEGLGSNGFVPNNPTTMNPNTMKLNGTNLEVETCSRCSGSGHFSFHSERGTTCFKCHGRGTTLTKRGAAAQAFMFSLLTKKKIAREVAVGESALIYSSNFGVQKSFQNVVAVETRIDPIGREVTTIKTDRPGQLPLSMSSREEIVVTTGVNAGDALAKAIEFQATLTKSGKPSKR